MSTLSDIFFNTDDTDVAPITVQYTRGVVTTDLVVRLFEPFSDGAGLGSTGLNTTTPVFFCPADALPTGAARGDTLVNGTDTYKVRDIKRDGTGLALITLETV